MTNYYRLAFTALFLFFSFSVVGPNLISAKDDFLFAVGMFYIVLVVPTIVYYLNEKMIQKIFDGIKE